MPVRPPIPGEFGEFVSRDVLRERVGSTFFKAMKKIDYLKKEIERVGPNSSKGRALAKKIDDIEKSMRARGAAINADPRGALARAEKDVLERRGIRAAGGRNSAAAMEGRMTRRANKRADVRKEYGIGKPKTQTKAVKKATPKKAKTTFKGGGGKKTVRDAYNEAKRGKK
jgi:hypothetical protein